MRDGPADGLPQHSSVLCAALGNGTAGLCQTMRAAGGRKNDDENKRLDFHNFLMC
jgi:hypothetical protein